MPAPPLITRRERNTAITLFLILLFVAAAANVPFAVTRIHSRTAPRAPTIFMLRDDQVGSRTWPAPTPHDEPWPEPTYYGLEREFAYSHHQVIRASESPTRNGFSMQLDRMGWPFAVLERKQMWWDWNDPTLKGPEPDPRMYLKPIGLVLNPIILAGIPWLVLVMPPTCFILARRLHRRRRGTCIYCAYPLEHATTCPECGTSYAPEDPP